MKIGIIGSGPAGQTLGKGFIRLGYEVRIGSRDPSKLSAWVEEVGPQGGAGISNAVAEWAELLIISVLGRGAEEAVRVAGIENFDGKIVIDASDPLDFSSGRPGLFVGTTDSLGERIQRLLPKAKVVKTFNTVLADVMIDPSLSGPDADMLMAGNDAEAKAVVTGILEAFGWSVVDMGDIENARWLEAVSLAWVVYSHKTGKTHHSFKILGK